MSNPSDFTTLSTRPVLSPSSLHHLSQSGTSTAVHNGWYRTLSLHSIPPYSTTHLDVPVRLNSPQSLSFCGMNNEVTKRLYSHWLSSSVDMGLEHRGNRLPVNAWARAYIEGMAKRENAYAREHDWDAALRGMGIKRATREGILDPEFENIRLTRSAREWALDKVEETWRWLEGLDGSVKSMIGEERGAWIV